MSLYEFTAYEPINHYALQRLQNRGDVYGWAPLAGEDGPSAVLLISEDAAAESFPIFVGGIRIVLKQIPQPMR